MPRSHSQRRSYPHDGNIVGEPATETTAARGVKCPTGQRVCAGIEQCTRRGEQRDVVCRAQDQREGNVQPRRRREARDPRAGVATGVSATSWCRRNVGVRKERYGVILLIRVDQLPSAARMPVAPAEPAHVPSRLSPVPPAKNGPPQAVYKQACAMYSLAIQIELPSTAADP